MQNTKHPFSGEGHFPEDLVNQLEAIMIRALDHLKKTSGRWMHSVCPPTIALLLYLAAQSHLVGHGLFVFIFHTQLPDQFAFNWFLLDR